MSKTLTIQITDTAIKAYKESDYEQLKDPRYPLYFRYHKDRDYGSFRLIQYFDGRSEPRICGKYPKDKAKTITESLKYKTFNRHAGLGRFKKVNDVLDWYLERIIDDSAKPDSEKSSVKCLINKWIKPAFKGLKLENFGGYEVESYLFRKMQKERALSYVRQAIKVLKACFSQAVDSYVLAENPISNLMFRQLSRAKIKQKTAAVLVKDMPLVKAKINNKIDHHPKHAVFSLMMLMHGTRIGETRALRWDYFDFKRNILHLPIEITKNKKPHEIPLTDSMIKLLKHYKKLAPENNVYLFGSNRRHISNKTAYNWVVNISDRDWTAHDLRKLFCDSLAALDIMDSVRKKLMNHSNGKLDETYVQSERIKLLRSALEKHHDWLINAHGLRFVTDLLPTPEKNITSYTVHSKWV